jgi:hypothetical protein
MLVNNGEGRTAMTWTLYNISWAVRGAGVRGDSTVSRNARVCRRARTVASEPREGGKQGK